MEFLIVKFQVFFVDRNVQGHNSIDFEVLIKLISQYQPSNFSSDLVVV